VIENQELRRIARTRSKYNSLAIAEGVNLLLQDDQRIARGNHSCDSNLWMRDPFTLEARRDIAPGEEITVDYALQTALPDWDMGLQMWLAALPQGHSRKRLDAPPNYKIATADISPHSSMIELRS